jgi:HAD superfamily hydrolase (TIGR01459 family)
LNKLPDPIAPALPPVLDGFRHLAPRYKLLLSDVWGVVHNGQHAYESACDALRRARAAGLIVVMVSNAPRPGTIVAKQIARWGVPADCYDTIVASGDVARNELLARPGSKVFHLGPQRDLPNYDGLDVELVGEADADLIVATGFFNDDVETPADYADMLASFAARRVPMLCANPDLVVERGDKLIWCAGALAADYEKLGAEVVYAGKPHAPIYDLAVREAETRLGRTVLKDEMLAIGDGPRTDLKGALLQGIDCLFVTGGIHVADFEGDASRGAALFVEQGAWPIAITHRLAW